MSYVFIVEVKRETVDNCINQALLALQAMWEDLAHHYNPLETDLVFAFVTDSEVWRLITYNGQKFRFSLPLTGLIEEMVVFEELHLSNNQHVKTTTEQVKQNFLTRCTEPYDIINSVLSIVNQQARRLIDEGRSN